MLQMLHRAARLLKIEIKDKIRNRKLIFLLVGLSLTYGVFIGMNITNYVDVTQRLEIDEADGFFVRVPLTDPVKTFSYFGNFTPHQFPVAGHEESKAGVIFLPDRLEDPGTVTRSGRFFFLLTACLLVIFAHSEMTVSREKGLLATLLTTPTGRREIFLAKSALGVGIAVLIFTCNMLITCAIALIGSLELTELHYQQIILYNCLYAFTMLIIYLFALGISARSANSGSAFVRSLIFLAIVVYVLPTTMENMRTVVFNWLPQEWRANWYWYSRYLQLGDLFGAFGDLVSDLLYPGRAKLYYASLPWTRHLVAGGEFTVGKLLLINLHRLLTFFLWWLTARLLCERRFMKSDAV